MDTIHKYRDKDTGKTYTAREYAQEHANNYCCTNHAIGAYCDKAGQAYRDNDTTLGGFYLAVAQEVEAMRGAVEFMEYLGKGGK
jgi:hypothetical protein